MKIDEVKFKITVVVFDRNLANRKRPLYRRDIYCSLDTYFQNHDIFLKFSERKKKDNKNIDFEINSYLCKVIETV